ncbi:hypothetical protein PENTCL1PPCAC_19333, partial [Pristionchus entomophagus]
EVERQPIMGKLLPLTGKNPDGKKLVLVAVKNVDITTDRLKNGKYSSSIPVFVVIWLLSYATDYGFYQARLSHVPFF